MNEKHIPMPDFKSHEERDAFFKEHAQYYSVVAKVGVGKYERLEAYTLAEAEKLAPTKALISGKGWLRYSVIGEQSALVKAVKPPMG